MNPLMRFKALKYLLKYVLEFFFYTYSMIVRKKPNKYVVYIIVSQKMFLF